MTVQPGLSPSLSTNAAGDTICSGDAIAITASPAGLANYEFQINGVTRQNGAGRVFNTTLITGTSTITIIATNASGCSGTATRVVFVPELVSSGDITTPADATICPGDDQPAINSNTLATASGAATVTYQWQYRTIGDPWQDIPGATTSSLATATINITETSQFQRLAFAIQNGVPCDATASTRDGGAAGSITITVDNRTVPTITTNDADNIICDSFAINFTAAGTVGTDTIAWLVNDNPVGMATQVWSPPAGTINDGDSVKVRITTAGPGGCVYESLPTVVTVQPGLSPSLSTNAAGDTICSGDAIAITASPAGLANYEFQINGVTRQNGAGRIFNTTLITGTSTITIIATNASGCSGTATRTVFVPELVSSGDITTPADATICPGDDQPAINSNTLATASGAATVTYQWQYRTIGDPWQDIPGATTSSLATATINITETSQFQRLAFAIQNGVPCDATASTKDGGAAGSITIIVDNRTVPTITTNDADNIICDSFAINFTAGGTVGTDTIAWLVNDNPVGVATQVWSPPAGTINDGDSVKVRITTAGPGGCEYESLPTVVTVQPNPTATINVSAPAGTICGGLDQFNVPFADSVTISTTLIPGASYQYFIDGAPISGVLAGVNSFTTDDFSVYDTDLHFEVGVNVITAGGCTGIATTTINLNYVTADPIQLSNGTISHNICAGTNPNLDLQSVGGEQAPDGVDDFNDGADYPDGAAITYQWQKRINGGTWEDIIGATTRNISSTILLETTFFRRKSTSTLNGKPCEAISSNIITINVAPDATGGNVERNTDPVLDTWVDLDEVICVGDSPQELRIANSVTGPGTIYQWQYSRNNLDWEDITIVNGYVIDATSTQYQPEAITAANISSVSSFTITAGGALGAGNFYRISVGADVFTVLIGEDNSILGGDGNVNTVDEVLALLEYKINNSGSGISAVDNRSNR